MKRVFGLIIIFLAIPLCLFADQKKDSTKVLSKKDSISVEKMISPKTIENKLIILKQQKSQLENEYNQILGAIAILENIIIEYNKSTQNVKNKPPK